MIESVVNVNILQLVFAAEETMRKNEFKIGSSSSSSIIPHFNFF